MTVIYSTPNGTIVTVDMNVQSSLRYARISDGRRNICLPFLAEIDGRWCEGEGQRFLHECATAQRFLPRQIPGTVSSFLRIGKGRMTYTLASEDAFHRWLDDTAGAMLDSVLPNRV